MYLQEISSHQRGVAASLFSLQQFTIRLAFFNLFVVAALGLMLRSFAVVKIPFDYTFLLHAHSHFAFGGWIMPLLIWLIMRYFTEISNRVGFFHWRNIITLMFLSAYGMLSSFPFQGYGFVSIVFSTLSIFAGFYMAIVIWKATTGKRQASSIHFLIAALFYLVLSSAGPFATGPLIALGQKGTSLYYNAIYFFLHFQYNGFFSFIILAVWMKIMEDQNKALNSNKIFLLFNLACIPSFFLSTLWDHPHIIIYFIGGLAAVLQIGGLFYLLKDSRKMKKVNPFTGLLMKLGLCAFGIKLILQVISALPLVADIAYQYRNFIIAYLHLVLLGGVTLTGLAFVLKSESALITWKMKTAISVFLFSFITTELLLVLQATGNIYGFSIPSFPMLMFYFSCLFPLACLWMACLTNNYFISYNRYQSKQKSALIHAGPYS